MSSNYMGKLKDRDPDFFEVVKAVLDKTQEKGALDPKTKTLIILFNDAVKGHGDAVKSLAAVARRLGATDAEISETIRLAFMASGLSGLVAGMDAFGEE
jgi:alkylhydroperoxidase/carboxymuconolactone decarboxylase family protein YurZ